MIVFDRKVYAREYAKKYPERLKEANRKHNASGKKWAYRLMKLYGITPEEYYAKLKEQGGVCATCSASPSGTGTLKRLHTDHDHKSGKFRGILCFTCNGILKEKVTVSVLRNLINYLQPSERLTSQAILYL